MMSSVARHMSQILIEIPVRHGMESWLRLLLESPLLGLLAQLIKGLFPVEAEVLKFMVDLGALLGRQRVSLAVD